MARPGTSPRAQRTTKSARGQAATATESADPIQRSAAAQPSAGAGSSSKGSARKSTSTAARPAQAQEPRKRTTSTSKAKKPSVKRAEADQRVAVKKSAASKSTAPSRSGPAKAATAPRAVKAEGKTVPTKARQAVQASVLPVRPGEDPWTEEELQEVRAELMADIDRLSEEIATSEAELVGLLRDGTDGAGRDPADIGSANFERDHGMSLANNAREMLDQSRFALRHIELGSYGICDNCGDPIGKGRLQAFPRATLCVSCKQREERR